MSINTGIVDKSKTDNNKHACYDTKAWVCGRELDCVNKPWILDIIHTTERFNTKFANKIYELLII